MLFLAIISLQLGCTTVEIAKEVSKASKSIQTSVENILNKEKNSSGVELSSNEINNSIKKEKEILETEKKKTKELAAKQKKITEIKFIDKTLKEIQIKFVEPALLRYDGDTQTVRFDTNACRLFLFFDLGIQTPKVEYFEMRDTSGDLISTKKNVESCYKNLNLG